jgi:hypothetical protein
MTVADLIAALHGCDPTSIVLIPAAPATSDASEPVVDVTPMAPGRFAHGPSAQCGAVRLSGFPMMLTLGDLGAADLHD